MNFVWGYEQVEKLFVKNYTNIQDLFSSVKIYKTERIHLLKITGEPHNEREYHHNIASLTRHLFSVFADPLFSSNILEYLYFFIL